MKRFLFSALLLQVMCAGVIKAQGPSTIESKKVQLPNGWSLTPAGTSLPLGDLPLNIALSKSHRYAAVTNNGQSVQTIQLLDAQNDRQLDQVTIAKSWGGLAFSEDEQSLYASGGDDNCIIRYAIRDNKLTAGDTIRLGNAYNGKKESSSAISPTGIALDGKRGVLYAVTKQDNSLYVIDLSTRQIKNKYPLGAEAYTCLLSPDRSALYISVWGGDQVKIFNTRNNVFADSIKVGDNPNDLCITKNGRYLFVANGNDNTVSVIDVKKRRVLETLNTAVYPTTLSGSTPNSVALDKNDKTLYIANADNNCLAVFNVQKPGHSNSLGFIPTGWYPSVVRVTGNKLYVANGKGNSSLPNPQGPNPTDKKEKVGIHSGDDSKPKIVQYIGGGLLMGSLSIIPVPAEKELAAYSQAVYHNTPYNTSVERSTDGQDGNPIPHKVGDASPIKHVFYIIKENRTYDQVLGDMPQGNGDTSLLLFGRHYTPNLHSIADNFVLLDNFYVDGEVSADGHNWSMGAYATDYMEKNWPTSYGGRGQGAVGGTALNKMYIWDQAKRSGVSFRTYGEFASGKNVRIPVLNDHYVPQYPPFNLKIMDTVRYHIWEKDFDSLVANNALPQLMTVYFPNDHTEGMAADRPTPFAHVADNDLAIGMFLEHLSHSPVWENSVVFMLEDDAQNGPDHVDAHRSPAFIAGGYVKRHYVDHTMYSTSSVIRTIELILGMPPMTQYDAAAMPMWRSFTSKPDNTAFTHLPANVNLSDINPKNTKLAAISKGLDFSKEDRVPDQVMNELTWKAVKGENAVMPTPVRAAFVKLTVNDGEGDD
ncbi:bifunctional YncE family protein/alkaline phosphatase family protein [Danxiaibacter flavus]|uniref:Bifunctional YncE family protein/alkaline phosphatase family protein n=1 Tax=Danxiaibacter flavus TaxID=3049108 RepID=A0ABV3ZHB6_9BACT|nr:bifunctional YncE family protein/alkaline phosphatase family protein [Chitinophagaceae bacterium DXS]